MDRPRSAPTRVSGPALRRLEEIRALGVGELDLSRVPAGRLKALSRHASSSWAAVIARMPRDRRIATLLAFARVFEATALDDAYRRTAGNLPANEAVRVETKPEDVARLSPLGHENINFLGRYSFALTESVARGESRSLHEPEEAGSQGGRAWLNPTFWSNDCRTPSSGLVGDGQLSAHHIPLPKPRPCFGSRFGSGVGAACSWACFRSW